MARRFVILGLILGLSALGYMTLGAVGSWSFLIPFRGAKLAALLLTGASIATATLLFQTITANRILTPSIMGFDSLYMAVLTVLVFTLGASGYAALPAPLLFFLNLGVMSALGILLFLALLAGGRGDMLKLVLTGIVLGILIRALSSCCWACRRWYRSRPSPSHGGCATGSTCSRSAPRRRPGWASPRGGARNRRWS